MKNINNFFKTLEKFKTHQDISQLKKETSELKVFPTSSVLHGFFCTKYKTREEFINHLLMTITLPIGAWVMMGQLILSSIFHIGKAIMYDLLWQHHLKSAAIFFSLGALYACLSCICAIGIAVAPVINFVSIITRLILSHNVIDSAHIEHISNLNSQAKSVQKAPIVVEVAPLSAREKYIQGEVQKAKEKAEVAFDQLLETNRTGVYR